MSTDYHPTASMEFKEEWEDKDYHYYKYLPCDNKPGVYEQRKVSKIGSKVYVDYHEGTNRWQHFYLNGKLEHKYYKTEKDTYTLMVYEVPDKSSVYHVNWFFSGKHLMTVEMIDPDYYAAIVNDKGIINYTEDEAKKDPVIEKLLHMKP